MTTRRRAGADEAASATDAAVDQGLIGNPTTTPETTPLAEPSATASEKSTRKATNPSAAAAPSTAKPKASRRAGSGTAAAQPSTSQLATSQPESPKAAPSEKPTGASTRKADPRTDTPTGRRGKASKKANPSLPESLPEAAPETTTATDPARPKPAATDSTPTPPASGDHPLVDAAALKTLLGPYRSGGAETLVDPEWLRQARRRRRDLGETMRAFDFETAQQRLPAADECFISRKIDGEFTCLAYRDGACLSLNPGGTVRIGAPFLDEAAARLKAAGVRSALLGGELYVRRSDGQRPRVHDVTRVARNPASQAEVDSLCFAVFNVYELDGQDPSGLYADALEAAQRLFAGGDRVQVVETVRGDRQRVFQQYRQWVEQEGAEGVVTRSDSSGIFKIKPRHSLDLAVVGFSEGIDDRTGLLHSLLVAIPTDADSFQIVGRVGGGFSDELRASLLTLLNQRLVASDYVEVNSDQVGYRMVEPGLVAELSCLDVVSRTSLGSTIDRMVLDWHGSERRWEGVRRLPLCSLISPQFVRLRDDKQARPEDLRLSQLSDITEIPELERNAAELRLPASTVLERAVATKVLKGATLVRKLLLWKTNKETLSPDHPAYVLHITDYSPNREAPLNHEIRVSSSEEQIRQFFAEWQAKAFVGGWKVVG